MLGPSGAMPVLSLQLDALESGVPMPIVDGGSKKRDLLKVMQNKRVRSDIQAQIHQIPMPKFFHYYTLLSLARRPGFKDLFIF